MAWFVVLVFLFIASMGLVLFALLSGNADVADGSNSTTQRSTGSTDGPGPDAREDKYHSFSSIMLQLFSITMGVDYDSFNAVTQRPSRPAVPLVLDPHFRLTLARSPP